MPAKKDKGGGILGGIPLGSILDVTDAIGATLFKVFLNRYEVEEKIEKVKDDARKKAQELKEEAIRTGYAVKKAFFRAVVEAIFLATGILALILGSIMIISDTIPLKYVLLGYGIIVSAAVVFILKTQK